MRNVVYVWVCCTTTRALALMWTRPHLRQIKLEPTTFGLSQSFSFAPVIHEAEFLRSNSEQTQQTNQFTHLLHFLHVWNSHLEEQDLCVITLLYIDNRCTLQMIRSIQGCFDCNLWNLLCISWPLLVFIPSNKKEMLSFLPGSYFSETPILPGRPTSTRSIALFNHLLF